METQILKRISEIAHMSRTFKGARQRFAKDESGAIILFALILFVLMVMMGGVAVDLMRYEATRTTLQNTLDRSTLAAASRSQKLVREGVVRDYFAKAGMTGDLKTVTVTEGLNFSAVQATALADTKPFFLHMIGIDKFEAPGASAAEQRISNVEVMLVLDVSGSMSGTKMTNLKAAANKFVNTVLSSDKEDRISIGLVPYNGQVNLGELMAAEYNVTLKMTTPDTRCVDLPTNPTSVYTTTELAPTLPLPSTAFADTYFSTNKVTSYDTADSTPLAGGRWCMPSSVNIVRPPTSDITKLQGYINGLKAEGATSINAGLKWGLAFLDPATRPVFAELAKDGVILDAYKARPFEYTDKEAMKVIVLMTDGEHWPEERMADAYKTGNSPIFKGSDGYYSIRHTTGRPAAAGSNEYFVPHLCVSTACKNGSDTTQAWRATPWSSGTAQSWQKIWTDFRVSYVAWQFYARALGNDTTREAKFNAQWSAFRQLTPVSTMDSQLQAICSLAKAKKNVEIYGIAFEAPAAGALQIKKCTSGYDPEEPNGNNPYYYVANGSTIGATFSSIATNITQLRLTQ